MAIYRQPIDHWYLERLLFLIAGLLVPISVFLGIQVSSSFFYLTVFVGSVMVLFALTGYCPMSIILTKLGVKAK
ncbi:DUF2892 domain-containing protein [Candidatus Parcubacteria bacterium]|nr:DUF2892 domain-containing protein [Patescibacteria group bacterium]MBU4309741.1 DUF2892 domain-containing protein [Patescibacteria group bacterium]MBU4431652.1 DUF2892 domain-containing protein [Patescibacteria group bacterium]MBU4578080.1 DUF2892 domain-containing protein [Patescibacteria group bacterium]MCG2696618.1 DUF2892 domain-containing protein [Candidatus Parcubacteria bacterium]